MTLFTIFTEPTKTFERLKERPRILIPYILIVLVALLTPLLGLMDGTLETGIIEQLNLAKQTVNDESIQIAKFSAFAVVIVAALLIPIISAFFYHLFCMFQSKTGYKKTLTIIIYANLIASLQSLIILFIHKISGITIIFSPIMFLDYNSLNVVISTLLSYINVFTIWYTILIFIGMRTIHEMTKKEAWITISIPLVFKILLTLIASSMMSSFI